MTSVRMVVEITDESDELVGFGVAAITVFGDGATTYRLEPDVYGVRSEAHAAVAA